MATHLLLNYVEQTDDDIIPPAEYDAVTYVAQPLPSTDQDATIITISGTVVIDADADGGTITVGVFDGWLNAEGVVVAGTRQIGDLIGVSLPDVAAMGDPLKQQFYMKWIDRVQPQSAFYVIARSNVGMGDLGVAFGAATIIAIGP